MSTKFLQINNFSALLDISLRLRYIILHDSLSFFLKLLFDQNDQKIVIFKLIYICLKVKYFLIISCDNRLLEMT